MPRNSPLVGLLASCLTIRIGLNHTNHLPSYSLLVFEGKKEGRRGRKGKGREGKGKDGRKDGRKRKEREGRKETNLKQESNRV